MFGPHVWAQELRNRAVQCSDEPPRIPGAAEESKKAEIGRLLSFGKPPGVLRAAVP